MQIKRKKVTFVAEWKECINGNYIIAWIEFENRSSPSVTRDCLNVMQMEATADSLFDELRDKYL